MSLLDTLIYGYRTVCVAGVALTRRNKINFASGFTSVDNPTTGATDVTATAGGGAPTGTGLVAVTGGVLNAAATALGAGVSAFLTTPSGANLATALTSALGFAKGGTGLTALGSALQALRTNAAATAMEWYTASAGASPGGATNEIQYNNGASFGGATNVTVGANYLAIGALPSALGHLRFGKDESAYARNAANTNDQCVWDFESGSNGRLWIGADRNQLSTTQVGTVGIYTSGTVAIGIGNQTKLYVDGVGGSLGLGYPTTGYSAPYAGMNGAFPKTLTAAQNYTFAAAEYCYSFFRIVSNGACQLNFPNATDAQGYFKYVWNISGGGTIAVKDVAGNGANSLASGTGAWFHFSLNSCKQITAAFAVV